MGGGWDFFKPKKGSINKNSTTGGRSFSPWFNGQTGSAMGSCGQAELPGEETAVDLFLCSLEVLQPLKRATAQGIAR